MNPGRGAVRICVSVSLLHAPSSWSLYEKQEAAAIYFMMLVCCPGDRASVFTSRRLTSVFLLVSLQANLNDSHNQMVVHWAGEKSNVIVALARDSVGAIDPKPSSVRTKENMPNWRCKFQGQMRLRNFAVTKSLEPDKLQYKITSTNTAVRHLV